MLKKHKVDKKKITLKDLDKVDSKQDSKIEINRGNKTKDNNLQPSRIILLKIAKYLIYGTLIIILAVGIFQILRSKRPKHITNIVEYNFAPSESITAQSYALAFTKEYLTYSSDSKSYLERVTPFMISALVGSTRPEMAKGTSDVIDALVWKVDKLDDNHSNIIVRAEIETSNHVDVETKMSATGEVETLPRVKKKTIYVSVPIFYSEGSYIVDDYPTFVPTPDYPTEVGIDTYIGQKVAMDEQKEEFKEILSNFFLTYTTGNTGQISYYMENNQKVKGYEGDYIFNGIKSLEAYMINENEAVVVVQILVKDAELDTIFAQRFTFELIKKTEQSKSEWYIKQFSQRGNLYE